jgi:hypothetical protein
MTLNPTPQISMVSLTKMQERKHLQKLIAKE